MRRGVIEYEVNGGEYNEELYFHAHSLGVSRDSDGNITHVMINDAGLDFGFNRILHAGWVEE